MGAVSGGLAGATSSGGDIESILNSALGGAQMGLMAGRVLLAMSPRMQEAMLRACFAAGTMLRTPDGLKAIEDFQVGDLVLSRDENDPAGPVEAKLVEETFQRVAEILHLHIAGQVIRTTAEHPFYAYDKGWVNAGELMVGDLLLTMEGEWVPVTDLLATGQYEPVYNLRVADFHTYFVGCDEWGFSVWAHNANCWNDFQSAIGAASGKLTPKQVQKAYSAAVNGNWNRFQKILGGKGFKADEIAGAYKSATNPGKVHTLEYRHQLKKTKVTDTVELEGQIQKSQIDRMNAILASEGMPGLQAKGGAYRPAVEKAGRAHVKKLPPAGTDAAGAPLAYLHGPDMVIGNDPFAIVGTGIKRNNSIIGGNSPRIAKEIASLPTDITAFDFRMLYLPPK